MPLTDVQEKIRDLMVRKQELHSKRAKLRAVRDMEINQANAAAKVLKDKAESDYSTATTCINDEIAQIEEAFADLDKLPDTAIEPK